MPVIQLTFKVNIILDLLNFVIFNVFGINKISTSSVYIATEF